MRKTEPQQPKRYNACQVLLETMGVIRKSNHHKLPAVPKNIAL